MNGKVKEIGGTEEARRVLLQWAMEPSTCMVSFKDGVYAFISAAPLKGSDLKKWGVRFSWAFSKRTPDCIPHDGLAIMWDENLFVCDIPELKETVDQVVWHCVELVASGLVWSKDWNVRRLA